MRNTPLIRSAAACLALLSLVGCVAYPVPVAYPAPGYAPAPLDGRGVAGYVGTTCSAGAYVCQVPPGPLGSECSCPALGAPSYGVIR